MNEIKNNFSSLPIEQILPIFSKVSEPGYCFYDEAPKRLIDLSNIALVCQDWQEMQKVGFVWQPLLNRFIRECKFNIDLSSAETCQDTIKLYIHNLGAFKSIWIKCAKKNNQSQNMIAYLKTANIFHSQVHFGINRTDVVSKLLIQGNTELVAKYMLFKPPYNVNLIAIGLLNSLASNEERAGGYKFCFDQMIKLNHDLSLCFAKNLFNPNFTATLALRSLFSCSQMKITDYISSGCNFSLAESNIPNFSLLHRMLPFAAKFYQNGQFVSFKRETVNISDEKLKKLLCQDPISETDLKNFILDLLTKANLNLDILCPAFGSIQIDTALAQLRQLGDTLPKGNAVSEALVEFDKLKQI